MADAEKKLCFVLMPFKEELKAVYINAIKPAIEQAGFKSLRVDELKGTFNINRKIIENIFNSYVIIADLTHWNPNVFYEMGVAHAIDNKTIMIIQDKENVPFDVSTYRCLKYKPNEQGFAELKTSIIESLESFIHWGKEPTNPVQEFKPNDALVPKSALAELEKKLQDLGFLLKEKEKQLLESQSQLKNAIPRKTYDEKSLQLDRINKELQELRQQLTTAEQQRRDLQQQFDLLEQEKFAALEKARVLEQKLAQKQIADQQIRQEKVPEPTKTLKPILSLRSQPLELSENDAKAMIVKNKFFASDWNKDGTGVKHQYEKKTIQKDIVVIDHATGLMWQQSGSDKSMDYDGAKKWLAELNKKGFAGFKDWRLPTLEEAMSLMEPEENKDGRYINPIFDKTQRWIWTSDPYKGASRAAWVVFFDYGGCDGSYWDDGGYVRAVRPGQSSSR